MGCVSTGTTWGLSEQCSRLWYKQALRGLSILAHNLSRLAVTHVPSPDTHCSRAPAPVSLGLFLLSLSRRVVELTFEAGTRRLGNEGKRTRSIPASVRPKCFKYSNRLGPSEARGLQILILLRQ